MQFQHAIVGGTFDHFHSGHEAMLIKAFESATKVTIGITTTNLTKSKTEPHSLEAYSIREENVTSFLAKSKYLDRTTIIPINDKYGTSLTDKSIDVIIVSPETESTAQEIVKKRIAMQSPHLEVITVPYVLTEDGIPISSERIRSGLIDRQGRSYPMLFKKILYLPDRLRQQLQDPFGEIITEPQQIKKMLSSEVRLITVGDIVTTAFIEAKINPTIAVIDLRTRRQELDPQTISQYFSSLIPSLTNPAGEIHPEFAKKFLEILKLDTPSVLCINGEEDLLTLPAILLSPLRTVVVYGQYAIGMVAIEVTEQMKKKIYLLIKEFRSK